MICKKAFNLFHDQVQSFWFLIARAHRYACLHLARCICNLALCWLRSWNIWKWKITSSKCFSQFFYFALSVATHQTLLLDFYRQKSALWSTRLYVNMMREIDETITISDKQNALMTDFTIFILKLQYAN